MSKKLGISISRQIGVFFIAAYESRPLRGPLNQEKSKKATPWCAVNEWLTSLWNRHRRVNAICSDEASLQINIIVFDFMPFAANSRRHQQQKKVTTDNSVMDSWLAHVNTFSAYIWIRFQSIIKTVLSYKYAAVEPYITILSKPRLSL